MGPKRCIVLPGSSLLPTAALAAPTHEGTLTPREPAILPAAARLTKRRTRLGLAGLAALAAAACASHAPAAANTETETASGRMLVETHCAECHAVGRNDRSRHRDAPALRTLSQSYSVAGLEESLAEGIIVGHPDMPEFKFPPGDVAAIIAYLESIQER